MILLLSFYKLFITFNLPIPLTDTISPLLIVVPFVVIGIQLIRTSPLLSSQHVYHSYQQLKYSTEIIYKLRIANLIMSTSLEREILNPALATASTLSDASIVLNDFVLHNNQHSWSLNHTIKYYVNLRPGSIRYSTLVVRNQEKLMVSWCRLQEHFEPEYKKEACDQNLISNTNTTIQYFFCSNN